MLALINVLQGVVGTRKGVALGPAEFLPAGPMPAERVPVPPVSFVN